MYAMRFMLLNLLLSCAIAFAQDAEKASLPSAALTPERAALKVELETIYETDQKHRLSLNKASDEKERAKLWAEQNAIDKANQARIDEILKTHGWPGKKEFGPKAALAAFLVVQHSTPEMMKRYLPVLQNAMENGDANKESVALLDDRVRMIEGRPQRYGSQVRRDPNTGKMTFWHIEDEESVDKRRAEMGLGPLAEYAKRFKGLEYVPFAERTDKAQPLKSHDVK
jgi:hypothetical protein